MGNRSKFSNKGGGLAKMPRLLRPSVELTAVEIACGHDGLLRGKPEPVVLLAAYHAASGRVSALARRMFRLRPGASFPCEVKPEGGVLLGPEAVLPLGGALVVLAVGIEEDTGDGLRAIYGALEDAASLRLWAADADMPAPLALTELPGALGAATRVHLVSGDLDARDLCRGDDYVGAAMIRLPAESCRARTERLHLVGPDRRNDWTALVRARLG